MSGLGPVGGGAGAAADRILQMRRDILDRNDGLKAIRDGAAQIEALSGPSAAPASDFGSALTSALDRVNATQTRADALSEGYERGQVTDIASVMVARQEASIAFEATLQTRNKLLSAYQDIMRMGV